MLHLVVLAMITTWDLNTGTTNGAVATLEQQLAGAGSISALTLDPNDGIDSSLVKLCTYGSPPFGSSLSPSCAGGMTDFQATLASQGYSGFVLTGTESPLLTNLSSAGVSGRTGPASHSPAAATPMTSMNSGMTMLGVEQLDPGMSFEGNSPGLRVRR